jgi:hypothetical protein
MSEPAADPDREPRLDAAYRAGAAEAPPSRLDAAIRAAARRAAGNRPRPLAGSRRWRLPFAMAAVLVLSVSLTLMLREQGAGRLDTSMPAAQTPPPATVRPGPPAAAEAPRAPSRASPPALAPRSETAPAAPSAEVPAGPARAPARLESATVPAPAAEARSAETAVAAPRTLMRAPAAPPADAARSVVPPWQDLQDQPAEQWRERILELWRARRLAEAEALIVEFRQRFPGERLPDMKQP